MNVYVKRVAISLCALFVTCSLARAQTPAPASAASGKIAAAAVWQPGMEFMQQVHQACDKNPGNFGACFVEQMQKYGAPPAAVAFTRRTDNQGILRDFRTAGPVDIAYAFYPYRANENQVWFIVNGNPPMIDVDDIHYFPHADLDTKPTYLQIKSQYPNVTVFPGDRSGTKNPLVMHSADGNFHIVVAYRLNNQCHACARVGSAYVEFNFDSSGKFLGSRITRVLDAQGNVASPSAAAPNASVAVPPNSSRMQSTPTSKPPISAAATPSSAKPAAIPAAQSAPTLHIPPASPVRPTYPSPATVPVPKPSNSSPTSGSNSSLPVLHFSDPTQPIQVKSGQQFTITLDSNRTTGYSWQLAANTDKSIVALRSTHYEAPGASQPGAGGHEVWTFAAAGAGRTDIRLEYVRPWEQNATPARQVTFAVNVQ